MGFWNNIITYATVGLLTIGAIGQRAPSARELAEVAVAQSSSPPAPDVPLLQPKPAAPSKAADSPRYLQLKLSISSPQDLKVKQGDSVVAGQVLADRVEERSRFTSQRRVLQLSLQQIESASITTPPRPKPVPVVNQLPPISYTEEEAAIAAAQMNVQQAERNFQYLQQSLKSEPLEESSAVAKAAVEVQDQQRLIDIQKRKIDAVALLKDLPDSVMVHEQEVLKQKEAALKLVEADYQLTQSKLSVASLAQTEKLQQLAQSLEKARAEQQLAIAKLQTKKDQRAYTEYEVSVTAARRAEERNQAEQGYSRQLQEAEQQRRERSFQIAQLRAKISEVDNQLSSLSVVTSPYGGVVRRVKVQGQNDNALSIKLTLAVSGTGAGGAGNGNATLTPVPLPPSSVAPVSAPS